MKSPPAFEKFAMQFHQDIWVLHKSLESAVSAGLSALTGAEKNELGRFLRDVEADPGVSFARLWNATPAAVGVAKEVDGRRIAACALQHLKDDA